MIRHRTAHVLLSLLIASTGLSAGPVKLIFDTDFMTDCDDAGALAMLHVLADQGECELLATFCSVAQDASAQAIGAVNTYYGRGAIPVAITKDVSAVTPKGLRNAYAPYLAAHYPHCAPSPIPDAVMEYRRVLAAQPNRSVVILTVGYATNLKNLLASPPDACSPLDGTALVAAKVRRWVNMGGNFEVRASPYPMNTTNVNWTRDTRSAVASIRAWPTEIVFNGREIGHSMRAGARLSRLPPDNPVRAAYEKWGNGTVKDNHCADLSATLFAVRGTSFGSDTYWTLQPGKISLNADASFAWSTNAVHAARPEYRMADALDTPGRGLLPPERIQKIMEDLILTTPRKP